MFLNVIDQLRILLIHPKLKSRSHIIQEHTLYWCTLQSCILQHSRHTWLILGLSFKMFLSFTHRINELLFSRLNWILTPSYMSMGCLWWIGLDMAKTGLIDINARFQNVFEVCSLSKATFVFWSDLNCSSRGCLGENGVRWG